MKLIVTIPAYNEEKTIAEVIKSIPRKIPRIRKVQVLVFDDGSIDKTAKEAKKAKADWIFSNKKNLGIAITFSKAVEKAIDLGADIIVNTDADNQYDQKEIIKIIKPILDGKADMVTGNRQIDTLKHMPPSKKYGNMIGSWVIRILTGSTVTDASCGLRAYSRQCAINFNLISSHTYTHETIIQALNNNFAIAEVPIKFKKRAYGQSRLIANVFSHVQRASGTIIRTLLMYKALKFFTSIGFVLIAVGMVGIIRFLYFFSIGNGSGHIQSIVISSIVIGVGFNTIIVGVLADLISINRRLLEKSTRK
jgi:glycosyltransferase involved in cell wall biosynthesis